MNLINYSFQFSTDYKEVIDKSKLSEIRKKDNHPLIKVYAVAHEGESKPRLIGKGNIVLKWFNNVIHDIHNKINVGIQCIKGHTQDNTLRDEKKLGEIVGKKLSYINNKLHSLVAIYFPDKNDSDYDVISMESNIDYTEDNTGNYIADKVNNIMRFALGKSSEVSPAFSGAKELHSMQFFENNNNTQDVENVQTERRVEEMTFEEIKGEIKKMGIYPTQLYSVRELIGTKSKDDDGNVIYVGGIDDKLTLEINKALPSIEPLNKQIDELKKENEKLSEIQTKYDSLQKEQERIKLLSKSKEIVKDRNLNDKKQIWIDKSLSKFNGSTEEELNKFVDEQLELYQEFYTLHNDKVESESKEVDNSENVNNDNDNEEFL